MSRYDYFGYYKPASPREAKGGIKAQSKWGAFGKSWWAKRWISVLESFNIGARLGRGRSYARSGQVVSIEIDKGIVRAKVQGTRARPYRVTIKVKVLNLSEWKRLAKILSTKALFAAKLLAGEMPENIEETFKEAGLSLFPEKAGDLETECSCPDWSNPCKHIAAVYYLLGEEFDRNPFLIFKLRGIEQEELTAFIGTHEPEPGGADLEKLSNLAGSNETALEPLSTDPDKFWEGNSREDLDYGEVNIPQMDAALPKRLGSFPFWRGKERFFAELENIYRKASPAGMDIFIGVNQTHLDF